MPNATAISLIVRPIQSVDLSFEVSGIIGEQNFKLAALGTRIAKFDLSAFYSNLLASANVGGRPGLLKYDSTKIHDELTSAVDAQQNPTGGPLLFALRAENVKALLDKAIKTRENSYYKKFVNQQAVINVMNQFYAPTNPPVAPLATKPDSLETLATTSQQQYDALNTALRADPSMAGVVKAATTDMVAVPITSTGNITAGSASVTNLSSLVNIAVGNGVWAPGIPPQTTIIAVNRASVNFG